MRHTIKALRPKDYSEAPETLGEHLKQRRRELGFFQREAANRMGIGTDMRRYLRGTWRLSPERARALEQFLATPDAELAPMLLPRRPRRNS